MDYLRQLGTRGSERWLRAGLLLAIFLFPISPVWLVGDPVLVQGSEHPLTQPKLFAVEALLLVLLVAWIWLRRPRLPTLAAYSGLALVVGYAVLSTGWAISPRLALVGSLHLAVSLALLIMLATELRNSAFTKAAPVVSGASVALQAAWALGQIGLGHDLGLRHLGEASLAADRQGVAKVPAGDTTWIRGHGSLPHPNVLAAYLAAALLLLGTLLAGGAKLRSQYKWLAAGVLALLILGLLATFSRVALLMVVLNGSLVLLFAWRRWHRLPRTLVVPVAAAIIGVLVFAPGLLGRTTLESQRETGVSNRMAGIEAAGQLIADFPAGVGEQNFVPTLPEVRPELPAYQVQPVHNVPLLIAAELSLIAAVLVVLFVWQTGAALHRLRPRARSEQLRNFGIFSLGGVSVVMGMFDHFFWSLPQGQWLIALYAAAVQSRLPAVK